MGACPLSEQKNWQKSAFWGFSSFRDALYPLNAPQNLFCCHHWFYAHCILLCPTLSRDGSLAALPGHRITQPLPWVVRVNFLTLSHWFLLNVALQTQSWFFTSSNSPIGLLIVDQATPPTSTVCQGGPGNRCASACQALEGLQVGCQDSISARPSQNITHIHITLDAMLHSKILTSKSLPKSATEVLIKFC